MRPDKSKSQAPRKSGAKDQKRDRQDGAPETGPKRARDSGDDTLATVRHREHKGRTLH